MKKILFKDCLVLNKNWTPCNIVTVRRAVNIAIKGRGKIIHPETLTPYSFDEWVNISYDVNPNEKLVYKGKPYRIPTIICAIFYNDLHLKFTQLNHQNIYKRDNYKCVYCGSSKDLTWDHIVPECRGGKTSWTNLVTCCRKCNNDKDDMNVEDFCSMKNIIVPKPISLATTPWLLGRSDFKPEWKNFVKS